MMKTFKLIFSIIFSAFSICAAASDTDSLQHISSKWEIQMRGGYAFNSKPILMKRKLPDSSSGNAALSWHLRYSSTHPCSKRTSSVYQGIGFSTTTFFQGESVGTPIGIYVFQGAPFFIVSENSSIDYEWNFGATFGWKPTTNGYNIKSNLIVGSNTNAYLNLSFKYSYFFASNWAMSAGVDLTHYSNGNTSWPNPGVNTIGAAVGISYLPNKNTRKPETPFSKDLNFSKGFSYDLMAYGAWRKAYYPIEDAAFTEEGEAALLPGHFGVAGLTFAPMYDIHPTFRAGLSADIQWSGCTGLLPPDNPNQRYRKPSFGKQIAGGLSARAELVMPFFAINAGIGYGLIGPGETRKLYQLLTLKTSLYGPLYLNIGYRLVEFHSPSNLMLGLGVTLR